MIAAIRRDRLLLILLAAVFIAHLFPPENRNENNRAKYVLASAWELARGVDIANVVAAPDRGGDDLGTRLLLAGILRATGAAEDPAARAPERTPLLYYVLLWVVDAVLLVVLYLALRALLNRAVAFLLCLIYLVGANMRFIAFSGDVYVFPVYAAILLLAALALVRRRGARVSALLCVCVIGVGLCNAFRNGSVLVAFGFVLCLLWPTGLVKREEARSVRLKATACLLGAVLVAALPRLTLGRSNHVFWHSFHCGLVEFGGHEDGRFNVYPFFVPAADLPKDARPITRWNDQRQARLAGRIEPGVGHYTTEYESILREDALRIAATYPWGMVKLIARRLWRLTCLNPWQQHTVDSLILRHSSDTAWRLFWLGVCVGGIWAGISRRTVFLCLALLPLLLPPLLVHSGYIMYNMPAQFPLYLFGVCAAVALARRLGGRLLSRRVPAVWRTSSSEAPVV